MGTSGIAPAVVLPATMAGSFARLRTRGQRLLIAGAVAGVGGAVLVAGGIYGLSGAGHLLPTALTTVDIPVGIRAASNGGGGHLSAAIATGMDALASVGGAIFRYTMGLASVVMMGQALHGYVVAAKKEVAPPLVSLLVSGTLMLGAWGVPTVIDALSDVTGVGARERIVSAVQSGAFEPAMVEDASDTHGGLPYLLAQRDQWQLQRPRSDSTKDLDAAYLATLRQSLARMPATTPVDPGIRYVLERTAHGRAQSEAAKAYEADTARAARRAQRWGRIGLALGALLLAAGLGLAGLGGVIAARVRRVQGWLPAATAR
ncbi:hypothetical protein [Cupriavidus sp. TMH.W2]|uniref:hypothetical protein n=1 Tax=Cupriavidus sp. TMH.W2 TaxID=3434465 RepID=UPI003D77FA20